MSKTEKLRTLAETHGVDVSGAANYMAIKKILKENSIIVNEEAGEVALTVDDVLVVIKDEPTNAKAVNSSYTTIDHELKELQFKFKHAENSLDVKRAEQLMVVVGDKVTTSGDPKALFKFLSWQNRYGHISTANYYVLNEMQAKMAKGLCLCQRQVNATHTRQGDEYPFNKHYDPTGGKEKKGCDVYTVFVKRTIDPEEQIGKDLAWKINNGFKPDKGDFPPSKIQWEGRTLIESEFNKYFKIIEDIELV